MDKTELINSSAQYLAVAAPYLKLIGGIAGQEAIKEVSKQAVKKIGEGSWAAAKGIWEKIQRSKSHTRDGLNSALIAAAKHPGDLAVQDDIRRKLDEILDDDPSLLTELQTILNVSTTVQMEGSHNVALGGLGSNNVVATGDGIVIGDGNINVVNKKV
jgi:hypothetical protein